MVFKIIISIIGISALIYSFLIDDKFARSLTGIQVLAIVLTLIPIEHFEDSGFILFATSAVIALGYSIFKREFYWVKRLALLFIVVPILVALLFRINHWPVIRVSGVFMLLPISTFLGICIFDFKSYRNELGFLAVFTTDAGIRFIMLLNSFSI